MAEIAVYVESKLLPPVQEVLAGLLPTLGITGMELWAENTDRHMPVLVLGKMPPIEPIKFVKTLSQKQILSNPAALTELEVAVRNLLKPPVLPKMTYAVVDGLTQREEMALGNELVVDIETGGEYEKLLPKEMYLLCVGINDGKNIYIFTEESLQADSTDNALDQIWRILTKPGRKLKAHNMKFDFPTIASMLGKGALYGHRDTMLLHHSINHGAKEHDLENLCEKYLGIPSWKNFATQYLKKRKDYALVPREVLYHYNAMDVYGTWHLDEYLVRAANADVRIAKIALHEFRMSHLFQDIEANGVGVNVPYLEELNAKFSAEFNEEVRILRELVGNPDYNPNSPQQVKKALAAYGVKVGNTEEKTLLKANATGEAAEFIKHHLLAKKATKMNGTYVKGIQKRMRGNIVYPSFKVHGTTTGRLSSNNPNIQNIPRDKALRKIFVPRAAGRTMVQVDYSQAELRVMAMLSDDDAMQALFQPDSPDFFDALMPVAFPDADIPSWTAQEYKDNRAKLKGIVYGLAYNRQAKAIAEELKMTVKEAQTIISNFMRRFPKFAAWRRKIVNMAQESDASIISPFGRMYQAELVTDRNRQSIINSALAFLPQSTASDMCVIAAIAVHGRLQSGQYGDTMIVATIHDAILLDVPDEYVESVSAMVMEEMNKAGRTTFGTKIYFAAEASQGASWGEAD